MLAIQTYEFLLIAALIVFAVVVVLEAIARNVTGALLAGGLALVTWALYTIFSP